MTHPINDAQQRAYERAKEAYGALDAAQFEQWRIPAPAVIPTRRSLPERAWRAVQRAFVRWQIRTNEQWLRDCEADNCLSPAHRNEVEFQQQVLRVRLAVLELT